MKRALTFFAAITSVVVVTLSIIKSQAQIAPTKDQSAAGIALPQGYRAATFSCW